MPNANPTYLGPLPSYAGTYPDCPSCGKTSGVVRDHFVMKPKGYCREYGLFGIDGGKPLLKRLGQPIRMVPAGPP